MQKRLSLYIESTLFKYPDGNYHVPSVNDVKEFTLVCDNLTELPTQYTEEFEGQTESVEVVAKLLEFKSNDDIGYVRYGFSFTAKPY